MNLKVLKDEDDHAQAIARLYALMDLEPEEGSIENDELEVLALLIERYEEEHFPVELPSPVDAILFRMDQQGLSRKDLAPYIGSLPKVSEVLHGKRTLSLAMIRRLHKGLGIPLDVLIQDPEQQEHFDQGVNWLDFPLKEMHQRGYFAGFNGTLSELKGYAQEVVGGFLKSVNLQSSAQPMMARATSHLRENDKMSDPAAMLAWQARVLHLAHSQPNLPAYVSGTVSQDWMRDLARLSWSQQGPALAVEFLNKAGIHVVIEKHLPKTYLDGAVCFSEARHPVVALTLRHDRLDNFWFTLMHELAHIALHFDGTETWYLDNLDAISTDPREDQADALAQEVLIPQDSIPNGLPTDAAGVGQLAQTLRILPCIIAGRARREAGSYQMFGRAFRSEKEVRRILTENGYL
ncbi:ImmA/IrrE family metallo-endopeptidase [Kineobactrum sediminis]|nr:ImmA/IrrE family metallo-endopeptidase [Kineobactrum sediminis]